MTEEFNPHQVNWTPEKIGRFWDYVAQNQSTEQNAFSAIAGDAVIDMASQYAGLEGNILDYGCSHGFLIEKLLKRGVRCEGLEFSVGTAEKVSRKFQHDKNFGGVTIVRNLPSPIESGKYDVIFVLEVLEHLLDIFLQQTLEELYRITKKGGIVVVSVPNSEDLDALKVLCPDCGGIFHIVQHVRSWNAQALVARMKEAGFQEVLCKITRLREGGRLSLARYIFMLLVHKFTGKKLPNLIYIGRKPE
jgi:2-polyprenyl-3-methyl-5-hydroxy-6-metoxy-1,4-benzoquinol methylase